MNLNEKCCSECNQTRPETAFARSGRSHTGKMSICQYCRHSRLGKDQKICNVCHRSRPLDFFGSEPRAPDGLRYVCGECANAQLRSWRARRRQHAREYYRAYRKRMTAKQLEMDKATRRRYAKRHPIKTRLHLQKWHAQNRERVRLVKQRYEARLKRLAPWKLKEWRLAKNLRKLARDGISYSREATRRRRVRIMAAGGDHSEEDFQALLAFCGYACVHCGVSEPFVSMTEDHVVPIVRGGEDYLENIQPLCPKCNSRKHAKVADYRSTEAVSLARSLSRNPNAHPA